MGLHHLVYEVVDNSVDEALAGFCSEASVMIHPDNSVTVRRRPRHSGATMEKEGKPAVEVVLTVLHSGGKFGDGGGYKVSGGLHGVGVSVVNALSERLNVEIRRDGYVFSQEYSRGAPAGRAEQGRETGEGRADRHDDHVPPRRRRLRDARLRLPHARRAPARDGVPHARPEDLDRRRARRRAFGGVPIPGRHRGLRHLFEREQGHSASQGRLLRRRIR